MDTKTDDVPCLPGAWLLLGYPPHSLFLTSQGKTQNLNGDGLGDDLVSPSISTDGKVIASAHRIAGDAFPRSPRLVISTYSVTDKKWTDYKDLEIRGGSVAISADGTKLVCNTQKTPTAPSGARILDLKTGEITPLPKIPEHASSFSWSPDGQRISFDAPIAPEIELGRAVYVLNIQAGTATKIAEGMAPSWSPSGERIAYIGNPNRQEQRMAVNEYHVSRIRPDGTDAQVLMEFRSDVLPDLKPVWSPDSAALLINVSRNADKDTFDAELIDSATLKVTKKFKNAPPIFGWVRAD